MGRGLRGIEGIRKGTSGRFGRHRGELYKKTNSLHCGSHCSRDCTSPDAKKFNFAAGSVELCRAFEAVGFSIERLVLSWGDLQFRVPLEAWPQKKFRAVAILAQGFGCEVLFGNLPEVIRRSLFSQWSSTSMGKTYQRRRMLDAGCQPTGCAE